MSANRTYSAWFKAETAEGSNVSFKVTTGRVPASEKKSALMAAAKKSKPGCKNYKIDSEIEEN